MTKANPSGKTGYEKPKLKKFGALHMTTRGTGGMSGDSGNVMTMME